MITCDTPFFIPVRDRLGCTYNLVSWLLDVMSIEPPKLYIIDMQSTYPLLLTQLDVWEELGVSVRRQPENYGAWGLFRNEIIAAEIPRNARFFVSDPDVYPDLPALHYLEYLHSMLDVHPMVGKLGLGLKIDDLPATDYRDHVLQHEKRYWTQPLSASLFAAPVATTFCICRSLDHLTRPENDPNTAGGDPIEGFRSARTKAPYLGRHLPWYQEGDLPEDERYYYDHVPHRTRSKVAGTSWKP